MCSAWRFRTPSKHRAALLTAIPAPSSRTTITLGCSSWRGGSTVPLERRSRDSATGSNGGPTGLGWPAPSAQSSPTSRPAYSRAVPIHAGLPMRSACRDERRTSQQFVHHVNAADIGAGYETEDTLPDSSACLLYTSDAADERSSV